MPAPRKNVTALARFLPLAATIILVACAAPPPPPPPPPPPAPVAVAPPRMPTPPGGAMLAMAIPPLRPDGLRQTPNRDLGELETLWHLRSALNVAALNCQDATHFRIADDYNKFLTAHRKALDNANRAIDDKYRREFGRDSKRVRDTHSTQVYNFFSLPPVKTEFCDAALVLGEEASVVPSDELVTFAARALPQLEGVFDRFFTAYENYQRDLAQWIALYAPEELQNMPASLQYQATPATGDPSATSPATTPAPTYGPSPGVSGTSN